MHILMFDKGIELNNLHESILHIYLQKTGALASVRRDGVSKCIIESALISKLQKAGALASYDTTARVNYIAYAI